ncbi:hypothetical protein C2E25_04170 [Geothermobacter hydrogeniphilus]|uniref:Uncharacterized protein n=1 Tax=Geothermobacter hydrogeniphilus TaxID=1969733 RepID=A0A2K2HCG6_9BACT|nr:hypothetical protein [Geothermobacter hydrogeniphilus]PNU21005.1 hypothetical protein C2E25_04170 [Geothermobacter hydrogeniphilus]
MTDLQQLSGVIEQLNYILGKIRLYRKQNQYVYLRPFASWNKDYNQVAETLKAQRLLSVPLFKLKDVDFSPSGKSIRPEAVDRLVRTIRQQLVRLEEKLEELEKAAVVPRPLERFFPRDREGRPIEPPAEDDLALVVVPAGTAGDPLFRRGIQPALAARGFRCFRAEGFLADSDGFAELCRRLHACRLVILDLAGCSPEAMLALGLACGCGKPVILLQPGEASAVVPVGSALLPYDDAATVAEELDAILTKVLETADAGTQKETR